MQSVTKLLGLKSFTALAKNRLHVWLGALLVILLSSATRDAFAQQDVPTIWSPLNKPGESTTGSCFFRKKFTIIKPDRGELLVDSNDQLSIFLNGREVDLSDCELQVDGLAKTDVSKLLQPGVNTIAVALNGGGSNGSGLALRLRVKETGEFKWRGLITDESWLTRTEEISAWQNSSFEDVTWLKARATGSAPRNWGQAAAADNNVRGTVKGLPMSAADNLAQKQTDPTTGSTSKPSPDRPGTKEIPVRKAATVNKLPEAASRKSASAAGTSLSLTDDSAPPAPADDRKQPATTRPDRPTGAAVASGTNPAANGAQNSPPIRQPSRPNPQPDNQPESQYKLAPGFALQQLMPSEETGSVIGMAFNEFGQLIFSREGGGLFLADLSIPYGRPRTMVLCDQVTNCQGVLPLNGRVYVTGQGPDGLALYELGRKGNDPKLTVQRSLLKFKGEVSEHGPHSIVLGPDGMLYIVIGNHSGIEAETSPRSPYRNSYDADLVPRYEDPGGHATGVKAPGGTIVRVSLDGKQMETFAGGLRNVYDIAFNSAGELFLHESDMEADLGLAWYRPTSLFHVTAGADLGWRSGWSQMPERYLDTVTPIAQTGRGSPTGIVSYQHLQFPEKYHDCLFLADWSEGRILSAHLDRKGGSYSAKTEVLLEGKPLNVTDLDVGEDGGLYFSTGGRGTQGGVFRIIWTGTSPIERLQFKDNLDRAVRHPQPNSAWARQNLALLRQTLGTEWNRSLTQFAMDTKQPVALRCRALEMLYLYSGPLPETDLQTLLQDRSIELRAKAAWLCGLTAETTDTLSKQLGDESELVRRVACESLLRQTEKPSADALWPLFKSGDRSVNLAARRLLEQLPNSDWCKTALEHEDLQVFLNGSLATLNAHPSLNNSYLILAKVSQLMQGFLRDPDFYDLLRLTQLALVRGQVDPGKVPAFIEQMVEEFPTASSDLNRELIRIIAYLAPGDANQRVRDYLEKSTDDEATKIIVTMHLAAKSVQLDDETRLALIDFLEKTQADKSSGTYKLYLIRCIREAAEALTSDGQKKVLENGLTWPNALVKVFYKLPEKIDSTTASKLVELDSQLANSGDPAAQQARLGIIALLAQSGEESAMDHLRTLWRNEEKRRADIAVGLAQQPDGKNWNYLVASLPLLDDKACQEVLQKLQSVSLRPVEPKYYRQVLELGYRLQNEGAQLAAELIQHWSTETVSTGEESWKNKLDAWKTWYESKWPLEPPVNATPTSNATGPAMDKILERLNSGTPGDPERGMIVFEQANCTKCHRVGLVGQSTGPDLTGLGKRFSQRETLESIVDPNRVISDRYRSLLVATSDGQQIMGMKIDESASEVSLLLADGKVAKLQKNEIEESKVVEKSTMPADLLKGLSLDQIADLIAYLHVDPTASQGSTKSGVR